MNKEADFAGTFYPEDADKLNELLDSYKQNINIDLIFLHKFICTPSQKGIKIANARIQYIPVSRFRIMYRSITSINVHTN